MAANLPPQQAERLAKLCGMLGSAHEGERASAAALATRMLRENGLTWSDVIVRPPDPPPRSPPPGAGGMPVPAHVQQARWALAQAGRLTDWEQQFLRSIAARRRAPTAKQMAVLARIVATLSQGGEA